MIDPHNEIEAGVKRNIPRDLFLHLLAIVTLYWSAISLITLCWQYINYFFPQALDYNYGFSGSIRFAVSSLIIVFPVFLLTSWFLNKIYRAESGVRESKIRKWLVYLTLFITALVIIGDLIFLVNTFLGGEITIRFILKALVIFVVTAKIFWYYLDDVRRSAVSPWAKYIAIEAAVIVLVLVVGSFFIIGSPKTARNIQNDQQKVSDLQQLEFMVSNYWQRNAKMPAQLADVSHFVGDYVAYNDRQTGEPYGYAIKSEANLSFELCATFNLPTQTVHNPKPILPEGGASENWDHPAGHYCFERVINQKLYPPTPPIK